MEMGSTDLSNFIKKEIQKNECVKEPTRVYIWFKILEAVKAIHDNGVIHSDLKPANFLLVGHEVKLIDFNISNAINDRTSVTVSCDCGTLNYMPPESFAKQNDNKVKVNQKSDVWALGCILYLMVYGRLPFQHIKNAYQLMYQLADPKTVIEFKPIADCKLLDVLKVNLFV
jgi:serine/threonine-protein kinase TTK/MPS1